MSLGPPTLDQAAYHGLPGLVVRTLEPHTEADPAGLLLHFLAMFGSAAGAGLHVYTDTAQPARLNVVVVGEAGGGRKGTAANGIRRLMHCADQDWNEHRVMPGISTAEALIALVDDDLATDRRLLVYESEFGRLLAMMRHHPNLVDILKQAYDGDKLQIRTKDRDGWRTATRAHISVIGHITPDVLDERLSLTELGSGLGNRFLYLTVARSKSLPRGGKLTDEQLDDLGDQIADALEFATELAFQHTDPISARLYEHFGMQPQLQLDRTDAFLDRWDELYEELNRRRPGVVGLVLQRAHTHVLRLAVCYALADRSKVLDLPHLEAANAVWRYCAGCAKQIFGGVTDSRDLDRVIHELRRAPGHELTRTEIVNVFNRAKKPYDAIIGQLLSDGWVTHRREYPPKGAKGRPTDIYTLTPDALEEDSN